MIKDYFRIAISNLRKRRLRSWLTMVGIFIGIATIVALVSLGQGMKIAIDEQFSTLGVDKVIIQPRGGFAPPGSSAITTELTTDDEEFVGRIKGIAETTSFAVTSVKFEFKDQVRHLQAFSIPTSGGRKLFEEVHNMKIEEGRDLAKGDKFKVAIGKALAEDDIFSPNMEVGDKALINDNEFKVIGIWERIGNPPDDKTISVSEDAFREIFSIPKRVDFILARTEAGETPRAVADRVEKELRKHRNVKEGNEDFSVSTSEELVNTFGDIINALQVVLIGIALISLIVGGIGIMNTMYTSVLERTREIGIMKAIGGRNSDILKIFLIEAGLLGTMGGAIGIAIGYTMSKAVEFYAVNALKITFLKTYFPWYLIVGALAFSYSVGIISGILPARHASLQEPVEALRYE
ncbi:ABC transporter permease [Candidatus Woesearchaeota archaeon]|nr:ABC transporter permease [Candidatus Woesearchaeota archaeon]